MAQSPHQSAALTEQRLREYCNHLRADRYDPSWGEEDKVLYATCLQVRGDAYEDIENFLDANRPPPLEVATMVNFCVARGKCTLAQAKDWYDPICVPGGQCNFSPSNAANMAWWANRVEPTALADALLAVRVPDHVKRALVEAYHRNRNVLFDSIAQLDPSRHNIYIATIEAARQRRADDQRALASYYARAAKLRPAIDRALLDRSVTQIELDAAIALRDDYLRACVERGRTPVYCVVGPVGRPLTKQIVRAAIALEDRTLAAVENEMLRLAPSQEQANIEIHYAVSAAMAAERPRYDDWMRAKRAQTDPKVLAAKYGAGPPARLDEETNQAGSPPQPILDFGREIAAIGDNAVERIERTLARVEPRGKQALLVFKDIVTTRDEETGCRETTQGNVTQRTECRGPVVRRAVYDRVVPIEVPAAEASGLRPGSLVAAIVQKQSRRGHVVVAWSSDKDKKLESLVQVRQFPIRRPATAPRPR